MARRRRHSFLADAALVALLVAAVLAPGAVGRGNPAQPDGEVKKKGGPYIGLGIINTSGVGQTVTVKRSQGKTAIFYFRYRNAGDESDHFLVGGCDAKGQKMRVRYFSGADNVTAAVNEGTLDLGEIDPGEIAPQVRAEVRVRGTATVGSVAEACVPAVGDSSNLRDEPEWNVEVK